MEQLISRNLGKASDKTANYQSSYVKYIQTILFKMPGWMDNKLESIFLGLSPYFDHIEVMSDKTEKEYLRLLSILQIAPSELLMVGNSFKSDIQPVLSLGGYGVHIPFEVMWTSPRYGQSKEIIPNVPAYSPGPANLPL